MTDRPDITPEPGNWASLIDLEPAPQRLWSSAELGAIFRHQLSAAVEFDLAAVHPTAGKRLTSLCAAQQLLVRSFGDLLFHPNPPLELLVMVKDFAKANARSRDSEIPENVARALYYLAIAAALVKHRRRITSVSDHELHDSFRWALDLPWIEGSAKALLVDAVKVLNEQPSGEPGR